MNPEQLAPVLTLFRLSPGNYSIRITDLKDQSLASSLVAKIPDVESITVITPNDMKVFKFDGKVSANGYRETSSESASVSEVEDLRDPMDKVVEMASAEEPVTPRKRGRPPKERTVGHAARCGRCMGTGKIQMLMDGGQPVEGICPVCQGSREVTRYGGR